MNYDKFSRLMIFLGLNFRQLIKGNQTLSNYTNRGKCVLYDFDEIRKNRKYNLGMNRN